ncbi:hypothetical protein VTO73DRAFT_4398 [Trametes versicolor]
MCPQHSGTEWSRTRRRSKQVCEGAYIQVAVVLFLYLWSGRRGVQPLAKTIIYSALVERYSHRIYARSTIHTTFAFHMSKEPPYQHSVPPRGKGAIIRPSLDDPASRRRQPTKSLTDGQIHSA